MNFLQPVPTAVLTAFLLCACDNHPSDDAVLKAGGTPEAERVPASPFKPEPRKKLPPGQDPVEEEINAFRQATRVLYNQSRFTELEALAASLRTSQEAFGNGSMRINQFYISFNIRPEDLESRWTQHDQIHGAWVRAKPDSATARTAYADFLADYAWRARGTGLIRTVSQANLALFRERLAACSGQLRACAAAKYRDPVWWHASQRVLLGLGGKPEEFDRVAEEAHSRFPKWWGGDISRAWSLLPEWYGRTGDWEKYAAKAAERPDGLGDEIYARIVQDMCSRYNNPFTETVASWPRTRKGYEIMGRKYPASLAVQTDEARLAWLAGDRERARAIFRRLGPGGDAAFRWRGEKERSEARSWAESEG